MNRIKSYKTTVHNKQDGLVITQSIYWTAIFLEKNSKIICFKIAAVSLLYKRGHSDITVSHACQEVAFCQVGHFWATIRQQRHFSKTLASDRSYAPCNHPNLPTLKFIFKKSFLTFFGGRPTLLDLPQLMPLPSKALGTGCTLTTVPRSTQPSALWWTVNEYQPYGWVMVQMAMGECLVYSSLQADSKVRFSAWLTNWRPPGDDWLSSTWP